MNNGLIQFLAFLGGCVVFFGGYKFVIFLKREYGPIGSEIIFWSIVAVIYGIYKVIKNSSDKNK